MATDDNLPDEVPITYAHDPGRGGPEIRAALSPQHRAEFDAEWSAAVEHAARGFDLEPALRLLDRWHTTAVLDANPDLADDWQRAVDRYQAGLEPLADTPYQPQSQVDQEEAAAVIAAALDTTPAGSVAEVTEAVIAAIHEAGYRFTREEET